MVNPFSLFTFPQNFNMNVKYSKHVEKKNCFFMCLCIELSVTRSQDCIAEKLVQRAQDNLFYNFATVVVFNLSLRHLIVPHAV